MTREVRRRLIVLPKPRSVALAAEQAPSGLDDFVPPHDLEVGAVHPDLAVRADDQGQQLADADVALEIVVADVQRYDVARGGIEVGALSRLVAGPTPER